MTADALDTERQVIGSLMLDTRRLPDVAEILRAEQFASRHHGTIYAAILAMHDEGQPVDPVMVFTRLAKQGDAEAVGGMPYIGKLGQQVANTANVVAHATTVAERAMERALKAAGGDIAELAGENMPVAEKLDRAGEILLRLSEQGGRGELKSFREILSDAIDEIEKRYERRGKITGDTTGFDALDERWDGLNAGDLIIVAGRPSMGKTALAMNIAEVAGRSRPVAISELEMPSVQLSHRMMASIADIPFRRVKRGDLLNPDWPKLTTAVGNLQARKLFIDDRGGQTLTQVRTFARKVKRQQGDLGLVVIDYLQIMDDEARKGESRAGAIQRITTGLKALAKELNCSVMLVSQLSRDVEKRRIRRPQLSDLRDSGSIEQDADIVAFVHREDYYREDDDAADNLAEIITAKCRNGETGSDFLEWQGEFQRFVTTHRTPKPKTTTRGKRGIDV